MHIRLYVLFECLLQILVGHVECPNRRTGGTDEIDYCKTPDTLKLETYMSGSSFLPISMPALEQAIFKQAVTGSQSLQNT